MAQQLPVSFRKRLKSIPSFHCFNYLIHVLLTLAEKHLKRYTPSTLIGDFLQFIIPYYIPSSCESEMPVPVTFVSILFSASYLVLEFQSAGTGVSFSWNCRWSQHTYHVVIIHSRFASWIREYIRIFKAAKNLQTLQPTLQRLFLILVDRFLL